MLKSDFSGVLVSLDEWNYRHGSWFTVCASSFDVFHENLCIISVYVQYRGFDFEGDEIQEKLMKIEESAWEDGVGEELNPDDVERIAREEYLKDKAERERKKLS